ncbi:MAG TPA: xanthine dehydrogenase family protein subunit M [Candidatus Acidoferrales bacterium]|nr:xanthine dehydrogenase family protein subunit M [Candidatus Acidoferrales bacterium]
MRPFTMTRAADLDDALHAAQPSQYCAGGTTLIDLMRQDVMRPERVIAINRLPLARIEPAADGGLRIGALATNSDVAHHERVRAEYRVLSEAILSGATTQIRNMATTGGNVLQRTRCIYFRDSHAACNKRDPGSGCPAITGYNRNLAVLGTSDRCIASNPSDQNVALMALGATIEARGAGPARAIPIEQFYRLPGDTPERETALEPGELIVAVTLPPMPGWRSHYLKLRDRQSYEFALASAAVAVRLDGTTIADVRIALGGVGTIPWRAPDAEAALRGTSVAREGFRAAAEIALRDARPQSENGFKIELARRALTQALIDVAA